MRILTACMQLMNNRKGMALLKIYSTKHKGTMAPKNYIAMLYRGAALKIRKFTIIIQCS